MHKPTIRRAVGEFIADRRSLHCKQRTIQFYRCNLGRVVAFVGKKRRVHKALTRSRIRAFFADLDGRDLSQDTLAVYDRVLRTFSAFCLREGWIDADPMADRPRLRQARNKLPDTFAVGEIRALLDTCEGTDVGLRDRAIMLLLLDTGMRAGELCGLTCDRCRRCPGGGRIEIPAELSKGSSDRFVMFCDDTAAALDAWLARRGDPAPGGFVFVALSGRGTLTGRPLTPGGLNQMIHRRVEAAGVTGHTRLCHIWRHTFAKMYVQGGGDLESLRRLLGHSSLETVRIYLRFGADELEDLHRRRAPVHKLGLAPKGQQKTPVTLITGVESADTRSDTVLDRLSESHLLN